MIRTASMARPTTAAARRREAVRPSGAARETASVRTHDEAERTVGLFRHLFHRPYGETSGINTSEFVRDLHVAIPLLYRGAGAGLGLLIADGLGLIALGVIVVVSAPLTGLVLLV